MSRLIGFTILSSDDLLDDDDNVLPPSDPLEPLSDEDTDPPNATRLPALHTLMHRKYSDTDPDTSPLQPRQVRRAPRLRSSSVPPMEPPLPIETDTRASDDILMTPRAERAFRTERAQLRRRQTLDLQKIQAQTEEEAAQAAQAAHEQLEQIEAEKEKLLRELFFDKILDSMSGARYTLAEFLDYVFDPKTKLKSDWRWRGFFLHKPIVRRIFNYWTSASYNGSTRATVHEWALALIADSTSSEARSITSSGVLSKSKKVIDEQFFLGYSLAGLTATLRGMAPTAFRIFDSFSTTARQLLENSASGLRRKELLRGSAALSLLRAASQYNNYAQAVNSAYLAATGAQRQHFAVFGALGSSLGYTSVVSKGVKADPVAVPDATPEEPVPPVSIEDVPASNDSTETPLAPDLDDEDVDYSDMPALLPPEGRLRGRQSHNKNKKKKTKSKKKARAPGLLTMLSAACNKTSQAIAASGLFVVVYDNINMMVRVAEQVLGRKNAQENGTCATVIPLHDAQLEDLLTASLDESILNAPHLRIDHLLLTDEEAAFHEKNMVHTILRIIVRHGGEGFKKWQNDLDAMQPVSSETIAVHKTPIHPLPSMEIDENSITGNIEVIDAITKSLGLSADDPEYTKYIKIVAGDQLTIARQRSILTVRLGHESGPHAWRHIVLMPGLFHAKIADCHGLLETHFGKPNAGTRSPGSLGFHNTVLDRLPITLTSLPPFRTCRDLIMVSLFARVLHCLLLVSGKPSLNDYSASVNSWTTIVDHATAIYTGYADPERVQELREQRIPEERKRDAAAKAKKGKQPPEGTPPHVKKGDMVLENAILFMRDALLTREFTDAVKMGDSGRVVIILRLWVFSYRGSGRSKYAHEMLHLLHNLICSWTKELRHVVLQNWLLCPTGKPNSFVEIDLVQEHLNFWIKKIYKADGEGHSWDWLALISPCVDILRSLATQIHTDLGARQGSKHTIPNLAADIGALMDSLDEHDVYTLQPGRVLDDDEKPVPDILSVGMAALIHGSSTTPLADFNQQFDTLRERRRLTPVADLLPLLTRDGASPADTELPDAAPQSASPDGSVTDGEVADLSLLADTGNSDEEDPEDDGEDEENLFLASPTLTRLDAGDVSLDMDVNEWDLDVAEEDDSDYDGSGDEGDESGDD